MHSLPPNPYIIGRPMFPNEPLFGRKDIFDLINDSLEQNVQIILFYGQRRVGKTSILKQIPQNIKEAIKDEFIFINNVDFQYQENSSLENILHYMAKTILDELQITDEFLDDLANDIESDVDAFTREFLPTIYHQLNNKKFVFLCDEFDVLSESNAKHIIQLLELDKRLFIIPVVGRHISRLPNLISLLRKAPYHKIGFLDKANTQKIITQDGQVRLTYQPEAIDAIFNLSAGHPYFIQVICSALYNLARQRHQNNPISDSLKITDKDVKSIINKAIELAEGALNLWFGLTPEQQIIISAVAEAQKIAIAQNQSSPEQPLTLLEKYGIVSTEYWKQAQDKLAEYELLDDTKCQVEIELFRCWVERNRPLQQEINNVETINQQDINSLISVAIHQPQAALHLYEQALRLNPNNFETVRYLAGEYLKIQDLNNACELYNRAYLFYSINNQQNIVLEPLLEIAEQYTQNKNFDQAIEVYTRAYKIDTEGSKDGLLKTRENYIHELIVNSEWTKAIKQCELILEIDPNSNIAQQRLKEINVLKTKTSLQTEKENAKPINKNPIATPNWLKRGSILITSLGLAGIVVIGTGISQFLRTCPTGERKELGVFCVVDNSRISRGDRTLFPSINNIPRDKGIQSFKKADYQQAAELFKKAVEANPNDPEVRIYYNNALTRQQGSPFTLAVVVPVGTNINDAQEILRGVAQAQDQFNKNKGFNGRLLEIVIANDSNKEQAKQVAQELVKDTSILGIIGHNSSDATQVALPEYAKAGLAVISPTSTSILLNNPVFFRAVYSDESGGKKLAEYTYKNLKLSKAVIFANPNSPYSNSIREVFTNEFEKLGGKVVPKPMIDLTATTFDAEKEVAKSVYGEKVQAALLFPDTQSINIAMKITKEITNRNERLKNSPQSSPIRQLKMLSGDTLYNIQTLDRGGKDAEGLIIAIPWFRDTPQTKPFAQKSDKIWEGGISWRTATSFDATQAFIKALSNNSSRTTVLERLEKVNLDPSETSGYPLQFTEDRERKGESILVEIRDGKFVEIK